MTALNFNEDNLTLLDVEFERQRIGMGLDIYLEGSTYYIPLVDLVSLLEMDINTQSNGAEGQLSAEGPPFSLVLSNGEWLATLAGNTSSPPPGRY